MYGYICIFVYIYLSSVYIYIHILNVYIYIYPVCMYIYIFIHVYISSVYIYIYIQIFTYFCGLNSSDNLHGEWFKANKIFPFFGGNFSIHFPARSTVHWVGLTSFLWGNSDLSILWPGPRILSTNCGSNRDLIHGF